MDAWAPEMLSSADVYYTPRLGDASPQSQRDASDSPQSQTTQYFTPESSFVDRGDDRLSNRPTESVTVLYSRPLHRLCRMCVASVKKKKRSKSKRALRRVVKCVACCGIREAVRAEPRQLRSGEVDLRRFEKSDGQIQEAFLPEKEEEEESKSDESIQSQLQSHPITLSRLTTVNDADDDADEFLKRLERLRRMCGTWQLVKSRSDSYAAMSALLELNWIFRTALENSDILQISVDDHTLHQRGRVFRLVDLHEEMDLAGEEVMLKRRDLRRGPAYAQTFFTPTGYVNKLHWNDPLAGGLTETMTFSEDGRELEVRLHIFRSDGRSCDLKLFWERRRH